MNIHETQIAIRKHIGHLVAKKGSESRAPYPVKSAKELSPRFQAALNEYNATYGPVAQTVNWQLMAPNEKGKQGTVAVVEATYRLTAEDGSFIEFRGLGMGADESDKAVGKASTYAWKDSIVKGFSLSDAEMVDTDDDHDVPIMTNIARAVTDFRKAINAAGSKQELRQVAEDIKAAGNAQVYEALRGDLNRRAEVLS